MRKTDSSRRKVVLVIAGQLVTAGVIAACGNSTQSKATSDEDQIRALMQREQTAFNTLDYNAFLQTVCAEFRPQQESQTTWVSKNKASMDAYGPIEFRVANIKVTGDAATADVSTKGQKEPESRRTTEAARYVREGGAWEDCSPAPPG
jgi:anti-sigma-K factor RskA